MKVKEIIKFTEWMPNPKKTVETPRFSIMMPTYRRFESGHLTQAIQSVLNQTYPEFELIIIDDGSVDGSFEEIQRFMKLDSRIHCLHHPRNVGLPAIGCYEAFLKSRGEYLMFCFDDTEYQKDALEKAEQYISEYKPKIAFGYIDFPYQDSNGNISHGLLGNDGLSQAYLKMTNFLPNLGVILHRDVPTEIGFLDPHLAVARITDWDYWKRAAKVYEIQYSGLHIGTEFGMVTGNSLGSTYPLNPWMAYEWTERERDLALTPGRFEEYDVQNIPNDFSDQGKLALQDLARFYEGKFWYVAQLSSTLVSTINQAGILDRNAKILVLTGTQDASVTLTFENIPGAEKNIRYVSPFYFECREMINSSAIIISRHLLSPEIRHWVEIARQLGIPHYYYIDDNFIILSKEILELKEYTENNVRKELSSFNGVLVSSRKLATFFLENNLHTKVHVFPPVISPNNWRDHSRIPKKPKDVTRIGFIGGPHRHNEFIELVLPAITRLAKEYAMELIIGGNHMIPTNVQSQLKIYQFPFDMSYRLALGRMQSANIDILVHAGSATHNNPYKTHNILLNAYMLKAFPVLANQPPYDDVEKLKLGLLCSGTNEWYEKILRAIVDQPLATQIQENLHKYVTENHSGKKNFEVLKTISEECRAPGVAMIDSRFRGYLDIVEKNTKWNPAVVYGTSRLVALLKRNRFWLLPPNSPQERLARFIFRKYGSFLKKETSHSTTWNPLSARGSLRLLRKLDYTLRPQASQWVGFEFMIGTHNQKAEGHLNIEIMDKIAGTTIRFQKIELNNIKDNQIVKVNFDEVQDSKDKDFRVRFSLQAPGPKTLISIYEENDDEPIGKNILHRLGLLTRGNTLACRLLYTNH